MTNSQVEAAMDSVVKQREKLVKLAAIELQKARKAEEEAQVADEAHAALLAQLGLDAGEAPSTGKGFVVSALGITILILWWCFGPENGNFFPDRLSAPWV
jgi:hypothetical protein